MASPNLTQVQAERRAALLDVADYTVEVDLTDGSGGPGEATYATTTTVRFACREPGAGCWIDFVGAGVRSAVLNGIELDVSGYREDEGIALPELAADNELIVVATGRYTNTGQGLHRFVDPVDGSVYLYTQFQTADAKRLFACFDQPDLKARYTLTVHAPGDWQVVSNTVAERTTDGPGGAVTRHFATSEIMSTYLVALVAGPYASWRDEYVDDRTGASIPLGIYCRASLARYMDADRLFAETKQGFGFFQHNFGIRYPFGKYDQLFVPQFNAGAMENAGAVTFLEDYVFRSRVTRSRYERRAETVLHEMAHMWFGDLVTMRWWDDLWLNESFATWASIFCQAEATEYTQAWTTFANIKKSRAYRQDQLPSTHPIAADIPDLEAVRVNFDSITYDKGASVLRQLVAYVGREPFLAGLRAYLTAHAWSNATFADLLAALQAASGRDLSGWGAQWLKTTGLNMLRPAFELDAAGRFTRFEVVQGGARPGAGELRTHRIAVGIYDERDGRIVRTHRVEVDVTGERTPVPALVGVPHGRLVLVNDDDLTYCALRFDPASLATVLDRIGDIADSLPRSLCWSAVWEMTREAELKARDFTAFIAAEFGAETDIGVLQRLLQQAQTAVSSYADEPWAAERGWPLLIDALLSRLDAAPAGSDIQLAVVNALTASVLPPPILERMRGWLAGVDVPAGLTVDTDLRWRLLHALIAHGAATEADIDAELKRDDTDGGRRNAEQARALIPTPEAKQRAWQRAVHDDDLPRAITVAIVNGFNHPAQRSLLTPYVEKYFAEIADLWARRTSEQAQPVVAGLFPSWAVAKTTVDAADAWLADQSHPCSAPQWKPLCRLVSEGRADVLRALTAREFDGS